MTVSFYIFAIVDNYDKGMKMLVKISKHPNSMLYSDVEEKGKGKRLKTRNKWFDDPIDATEESKWERKQSNAVLPPIPKFTSVANISTLRIPENRENKVAKLSNTKLSVSKHNELKTIESKTVDISHLSTNNARLYGAEQKNSLHSLKHKKAMTNMLQSDIAKENNINYSNKECCNIKDISSINNGCKMNPKAIHKCAYALNGTASLESIADAVCFLSSMFTFYLFNLFCLFVYLVTSIKHKLIITLLFCSDELSACKLLLRETDKTIQTFIESEVTSNKNVSFNEQSKFDSGNYLNEFPLSTLDELKAFERKIKKDDTYRSKIVRNIYMQYFILIKY